MFSKVVLYTIPTQSRTENVFLFEGGWSHPLGRIHVLTFSTFQSCPRSLARGHVTPPSGHSTFAFVVMFPSLVLLDSLL